MARFTSELVLRLVDALSGPARQATQSVRGITRAIRENNMQQLASVSQSLRGEVRGLSGQLLGATGAMTAFGFAINVPLSKARAFESGMTDIAQKADLSREAASKMGDELLALGPKVNQTAGDLQKGVDTLAGFGLDPRVAMNMIGPIGRAATAYKAQISDLAAASYAAVSNLKVPVQQTGAVIDVMAYAGKRGAFEIKEMAQYMPALAASAQGLGQSGVSAVADLSAALQVARKGAGDSAEAATNVGNLMQKLSSPATARAFAKMGVDLVGSMKALERDGRTPIEAISELTNKTLNGDLSRLGYLFEDAQVQKALRPLISNIDEYRDIRAKAMKANGTAERDYVERMKDAAEKSRLLKVEADALQVQLGKAMLPTITAITSAVTPWVHGLTALISAHPRVTAAVIGAIGALVAFRLASVATKFAVAQTKLSIADMGKGFLGLKKNVVGALKPIGLASQFAALNMETFVGGMKPGGVQQFARALLGLNKSTGVARVGFGLLRVALISTGIGAAVIGIGLAAAFVVRHWSGFVTFFQGVGKGFSAAIAPLRPALEPLIGGIRALVGWVGGLFKGKPGEDWTQYGVAVGAAIGGAVMNLVNFVKWIGECITAVTTFFGIKGGAPQVGVPGKPGAGPPAGPAAPAKGLPARAKGGPVQPGQDYLVGERGPEIARFSRPATIFPNGARPPGGSGGRGGSPAMNITLNISGVAGDPGQIAETIMARLKRGASELSDAAFADSDLRTA